MREIILGVAAAVVIAIGAGFWLDTVQTSTADRNTVSTTVRL